MKKEKIVYCNGKYIRTKVHTPVQPILLENIFSDLRAYYERKRKEMVTTTASIATINCKNSKEEENATERGKINK